MQQGREVVGSDPDSTAGWVAGTASATSCDWEVVLSDALRLELTQHWPQYMRQEWSDDRFARAAATQRPDLVQRLARYPKAHHEFRAELPEVWGDDQFGFLHGQRGR